MDEPAPAPEPERATLGRFAETLPGGTLIWRSSTDRAPIYIGCNLFLIPPVAWFVWITWYMILTPGDPMPLFILSVWAALGAIAALTVVGTILRFTSYLFDRRPVLTADMLGLEELIYGLRRRRETWGNITGIEKMRADPNNPFALIPKNWRMYVIVHIKRDGDAKKWWLYAPQFGETQTSLHAALDKVWRERSPYASGRANG